MKCDVSFPRWFDKLTMLRTMLSEVEAKRESRTWVLVFSFFFIVGCQTAPYSPKPTQEDTVSALKSINTALSAQHRVKYCPVDGQRFSADMTYCPIHHVKLKWVE